MSDAIDLVFLGVNGAGMRIYDWLCERSGVFVHSLLTTKEQLQAIVDIEPDYVVSCGYRHIVPSHILEVPSEGCINIHPAYLPYNRGANPNVWSIVDGTPAGVTVHYMDRDIDTGPIISQQEIEPQFSDTGKSLYDRLEDAQVELFKQTWPRVETNDISVREQNKDIGTYHRTDEFEKLCELDPDEEVRLKDFLDKLRALTFPPHENAYLDVDGQRYYLELSVEEAD